MAHTSPSGGERPGGRFGADRSLALIRILALPVVFFGEHIVRLRGEASGFFAYVVALTALYAVGALALTYTRHRHRILPAVYVGLDLLLICALALASGGETSEVRRAFFLPPVAAAFLLQPGPTVVTGLAAVGGYLLIGLTDPPFGSLEVPDFVVVHALYIAWFAAAATILCWTLTVQARRIEQLAADRGRLVAQAIEAEERERRRISEALHDEAVQNLLAARLDLDEAANGNRESIDRVREEVERTLVQLRQSVADLHPIALSQNGLVAALQAVAERQERHGGFRASVRVDPRAVEVCDHLALSLAREFITNAAKHAEASRVSLLVERRAEVILVEVADDGKGIPSERPEEALRQGHIGLASSAERVRALGGALEVDTGPGEGTVVRASIPLAACEVTGGAERLPAATDQPIG